MLRGCSALLLIAAACSQTVSPAAPPPASPPAPATPTPTPVATEPVADQGPAVRSCDASTPGELERSYAARRDAYSERVDALETRLQEAHEVWVLDAGTCRHVVRGETEGSWTWTSDWQPSPRGRARTTREFTLSDRLTASSPTQQTERPDGTRLGAASALVDIVEYGRFVAFDDHAITYDPRSTGSVVLRCVDLSPQLSDGTVCECTSNHALRLHPIAAHGGGSKTVYARKRVIGDQCPPCPDAPSSCEFEAECTANRLGPWLPQLPHPENAQPLVFWTHSACTTESKRPH